MTTPEIAKLIIEDIKKETGTNIIFEEGKCEFHDKNKQCITNRCPFFPG